MLEHSSAIAIATHWMKIMAMIQPHTCSLDLLFCEQTIPPVPA
jgi:hypothetical protein